MDITLPAYRKAFLLYLRRGVPIILHKAEYPTPYYIWHTNGDDKVRPSHAANNGKIFAWDNPPETGHPGEDYGCRCWAEDYYGFIEKPSRNTIQDIIIQHIKDYIDRTDKWDNFTMSAHFYVGDGKPVTLDEIEHLQDIKSYYEEHYFEKFIEQIRSKANISPNGYFYDDFKNSYDFEDLIYSYGGSTLSGNFNGYIEEMASGKRMVHGVVDIEFYDKFTDPISIREKLVQRINELPISPKITEKDLFEFIRNWSELNGTAYEITGNWQAEIHVYLDEQNTNY